MRRPHRALQPLAAASAAFLALAHPPAARAEVSGPVVHVSLAGGGELGLVASQPPGVFEIAAGAGWELGALGLRPELEFAFGLAPGTHVALRPGLSWSVPRLPLRLRAALDAANARGQDFGWRWLVVGAAAEVRLTGRLGFDAGIDLGAPVANQAGLPVLVRVGTSIRF